MRRDITAMPGIPCDALWPVETFTVNAGKDIRIPDDDAEIWQFDGSIAGCLFDIRIGDTSVRFINLVSFGSSVDENDSSSLGRQSLLF